MNALSELYGTPAQKIWRRVQDIPWNIRIAGDFLFRGEFSRHYAAVRDYTMSSPARLRALYMSVDRVCRESIGGDIVECGTARGGSAAMMGLALKARDAKRRLWVFDTFEGLPAPTSSDPDYDSAKDYTGTCRGSIQEVESLFSKLGLTDNTQLVKGLFQDTVPVSTMSSIAVLHLDGDWYDSTMICLNHLYDRVTPGGVIQIDDYGHWQGARKALHDFLDARGIKVKLKYLDYTGRQFVKPDALHSGGLGRLSR